MGESAPLLCCAYTKENETPGGTLLPTERRELSAFSGRVCVDAFARDRNLVGRLWCARWKSLARGIAGALSASGTFVGWVAYQGGVLELELRDARGLVLCNAVCCTVCAFVRSWTRAPGRVGTSRVFCDATSRPETWTAIS